MQIGKALMEALKKLVSEDKLPPALAVRVMKAFDRVCANERECMYVYVRLYAARTRSRPMSNSGNSTHTYVYVRVCVCANGKEKN